MVSKAHRAVHQMANLFTYRCHKWGQEMPLLAGNCNSSDASFCGKKSCSEVTKEDWLKEINTIFNLEETDANSRT